MKRIAFLLLIFSFQFPFLTSQFSLPAPLYAQRPNQAYWDYIEKYHTMAQDQMQRHKIPASITLSQALLESGAGRSDLAVRANNHFGIKVSTGWDGPWVVKNDDKPNERFRKYNSVEESYEDHSQFLMKSRYQSLFQLSPTDYKGWAQGLKECGYATSPTYAQQLITIIENYGLHQYDKESRGHKHHRGDVATPKAEEPQKKSTKTNYKEMAQEAFFAVHPVHACNQNYYIVARAEDDLETIALMTGVKKRKLARYNEWPKGYQPKAGDIIYLQEKLPKADASLNGLSHLVQPGESLYDIAQRYGMKLSTLYELNGLDSDYVPQAGHTLRVN